ncbi:acyl-coenzyme A thioesterase 2, mitochondrial-like [Diadema antillarum]|uniref:acyl-coenzyme A thioesterase 2, mitochondrial-like n=1 Tax=Diadema antillarum TaxID=105358 RepID=UPI003A8365EA
MAMPGIWQDFARRTCRLLAGFNGFKLFHSRAPAIEVYPQVGMMDEQVIIGASGLEPRQQIILRSSVKSECGKYSFQAHATYEADNLGRVRVSEQPSLGGTYSGLDPMGLLWGVVPDAESAKKKARLFKTDPDIHHWVYTLDLCDGHVPNVDQGPGEILASETLTRRFIAPYVEDILEFARSHPRIDHTRIGISGSSMGGSLTLNAVPRLTDFPVRCVSVAKCMDILSMYLGLQGPGGSFIQPAPLTRENRYSNVTQDEHGTLWVDPDFNNHVFDAANHEDYVAPAAERMRQAGNGHLVHFVHLPGAGHLLETPYLPLSTESRVYVPGVLDAVYARWGGEPKLHAEAQVKAWQKMLDFFRQHLGPVEALRRDWLSTTSTCI